MLWFVARRLLLSIPAFMLATMIVFGLVAAQGDPLDDVRYQPGVSVERIRALEAEHHLGDGVAVRYVRWLGDFVQGRWGSSFEYRRPVADLIGAALPNSLLLLVAAIAVSTLGGIALGVWGAVRERMPADHVVTAFSYVGLSMPTFLVGLLLQLVLVVAPYELLGIRPFRLQGMHSPGGEGQVLDLVRHMVLPVLTLAMANAAVLSRFQRAGMVEELRAEYVRTAVAKGLPRRTVVVRHALRNALVPVVTLTAVNVAALTGGAIVIERIFAWPGMGTLFLDAIGRHDYPVVLAWLAVTSSAVVVASTVADLAYGALDPRVRVR